MSADPFSLLGMEIERRKAFPGYSRPGNTRAG